MLPLMLSHGGGGGSKLRLDAGILSSGLTVAKVVELSSPIREGCNGDEGGSVSDGEGRTVESEEPKEVQEAEVVVQPLLLLLAEVRLTTVSVVKMLLLCSSAFGVETSGVAAMLVMLTKNVLAL